jgi:non-specific serine/threonine protein kinase
VRYLLAALASLAGLLLLAGCSDAAPAWRPSVSAPDARTEVAGAALSRRVAVVGGVTASGRASARVDLYDPRRRRWIRLPDLPEARHHAMAATRGGRLYVVGGYRPESEGGAPADTAWVLFDRRWRPLPRLPEPRAAGGAAIVRNRLYVIGGVSSSSPRRLAASSLHLDLRTLDWTGFAGIDPAREHLGVTSLFGRVYAVGGRTGDLGTNVATAESYDTIRRAWTRLPDAPTARGGNGATAADRRIVVVGGERPAGTIPQVDAYDPVSGTWRTLPPSPRPRHGTAVVGIGRTVYQAMGGPEPGLSVSPTLMALRVPRGD